MPTIDSDTSRQGKQKITSSKACIGRTKSRALNSPAARYLALSPHSLECYRSLGGGPPFYKFGKFVRYAVPDLEAWAAERRHGRTAGENARVY